MEAFKEEILGNIKELNLYDEIEFADIPKLDLYMDQVITLFETGLKGLKRGDDDKILTKTMINNYSKDKLLMPAKNKKYSRNHIIMMILIYNLKQTLSINDIKAVLSKIVKVSENNKMEDIDIGKLYEDFLYLKKAEADSFEEEVEKKLELILDECKGKDIEKENYEKLLLVVLSLVNSSNMQKRLAEKLIDQYLKCELD
jgi:hypothetical protein